MTQFSEDPFVIRQGRIRRGKINTSYRLGWTEDSFIMDRGGRETVGRTFDSSKSYFLMIGIIVFVGLLFARSAWLQVVKGEYYYKMAEGNRIRVERLEARRGIIYDRHHIPLVRNQANFLLYVIPADLPRDAAERSKMIGRISDILAPLSLRGDGGDKPDRVLGSKEVASSIDQALASIKANSLEALSPVFIADNIPYEKALLLGLESNSWPGVILSNKVRREYNLIASSMSHLLGYTGKINQKELDASGDSYLQIDYVGKSGLEKYYEKNLRGTNGKKQIEVDALGKEKKIISSESGQDGSDLVLSIDLDLQKKIEEVARATIEKAKLKKAAVIAIDPRNGEVLAMVNLPGYDDNLFARGIRYDDYQKLLKDPDNPLFNRVVSGEFPSGSTIKPVMAAAALEEGIVTPDTKFLSNGGLRIGQWFFPDWKSGGHGMTDVRKALAESVNTFFYIVGGGYQNTTGLGVERIVKYDRLFGLGVTSGIDLPGEATGFLPSIEWKKEVKKESWYVGDTYHLSIGQGDLTATPLQIANFTAAMANGGTIYQPRLVKSIVSPSTGLEDPTQVKIIRQGMVKDSTIQVVREGMRQTVVAGSARSLQTVPVSVAGKTGTAQWSSKKAPHAWFTGFAPYDNPTIAITILVEEGKEGSTVAVPIAKEVLSWYFTPHNALKVATSTATSTAAKN